MVRLITPFCSEKMETKSQGQFLITQSAHAGHCRLVLPSVVWGLRGRDSNFCRLYIDFNDSSSRYLGKLSLISRQQYVKTIQSETCMLSFDVLHNILLNVESLQYKSKFDAQNWLWDKNSLKPVIFLFICMHTFFHLEDP